MNNENWHQEPQFRLAWLLKDIQHRRSHLAQQALNSMGLHFGHPRILFTIAHMEGASQKEVADQLNVTPASLATSLKRLQKGGFLARSIDDHDQRVNKIELTPKGRDAINICHLQMHGIDSLMVAGLSDTEKGRLIALLTRLNDNLEQVGPDDLEAAMAAESQRQQQISPEVNT